MGKVHGFDGGSADRVAKSVIQTEGQNRFNNGGRRDKDSYPSDSWLGEITNSGPNGEDDFEDHRYWVRRIVFKDADPSQIPVVNGIPAVEPESFFLDSVDIPTLINRWWVGATNLLERDSLLHELRRGTIVEVHPKRLPSGEVRYVLLHPVKGFIFLWITGSSPGGPTDDNRWTYSGTRVFIDENGNIDLADEDGIQTFSGVFNLCETGNEPDPSIRGNSVDSGNSTYEDSDFLLQPVRGNPVVVAYGEARRDPLTGEVTRVVFFQSENADDGNC